jgi:hypothetical protein
VRRSLRKAQEAGRGLELNIAIRWPQLATLRPARVALWLFVATPLSAALPLLVPPTRKSPLTTSAIMVAAFALCCGPIALWLRRQWRERTDLPRWAPIGYARSALPAGIAIAALLAPTFAVGLACDRANAALHDEASLVDLVTGAVHDVDHVGSVDITASTAVSLPLAPDVIAYRLCVKSLQREAGGAMAWRPGNIASEYAPRLDPLPYQGSDVSGSCRQVDYRYVARMPDASKPVAEELHIAGGNAKTVLEAHDLFGFFAASHNPLSMSLLLSVVAFVALLSSTAGILSGRVIATVTGVFAVIAIAADQLPHSMTEPLLGRIANAPSPLAWSLYTVFVVGTIVAIVAQRRQRPLFDVAIMIAVLGPLFILALQRAFDRSSFQLVNVTTQTVPLAEAIHYRFSLPAHSLYTVVVLAGALLGQTAAFPLLSMYRRLPHAS